MEAVSSILQPGLALCVLFGQAVLPAWMWCQGTERKTHVPQTGGY